MKKLEASVIAAFVAGSLALCGCASIAPSAPAQEAQSSEQTAIVESAEQGQPAENGGAAESGDGAVATSEDADWEETDEDAEALSESTSFGDSSAGQQTTATANAALSGSGITYRENGNLYDLDGTLILDKAGHDFQIAGPLSEGKIFVAWKSQDVEHDDYWDRDTVSNEAINCGFVDEKGNLVIDLSSVPSKLDNGIQRAFNPFAGSYFHDGIAYVEFGDYWAFIDETGNVLLNENDFNDYDGQEGKLQDWEFFGVIGDEALETDSWTDGLTNEGYLKLMKRVGGDLGSLGLYDLKSGKMVKELSGDVLADTSYGYDIGDKYLVLDGYGESACKVLDWDGNVVFDSASLVGDHFDEVDGSLMAEEFFNADSGLVVLEGRKTFADDTTGAMRGVYDYSKGEWAIDPIDEEKEGVKVPVEVRGEYILAREKADNRYFILDRSGNVVVEGFSDMRPYQGDWWLCIGPVDDMDATYYLANTKTGARVEFDHGDVLDMWGNHSYDSDDLIESVG